TAVFTISPFTLSSTAGIQITAVSASTAAGTSIPGAGQDGTISIAHPFSPTSSSTLSGLSCSPPTLGINGWATCSVSLSTAAVNPTVVSLSSSSANLPVPSSVTVAAGQTRAFFNVTPGSTISTAQNVTL